MLRPPSPRRRGGRAAAHRRHIRRPHRRRHLLLAHMYMYALPLRRRPVRRRSPSVAGTTDITVTMTQTNSTFVGGTKITMASRASCGLSPLRFNTPPRKKERAVLAIRWAAASDSPDSRPLCQLGRRLARTPITFMALDASSCRVALGVMTIPANAKRRDAARQTWMATAGPQLLVRFLLRALGLPRRVRNELTDEQKRSKDLWLLQVAGGSKADPLNYVTRGRLLTLLGWFKLVPALCPGAEWVAKADDDAYIVTADWEAQLRLIRQSVAQPSVLYGYLTWHNYDVSLYAPKSFSFTYAPGVHWRRAILFLAGDASVARIPSETRELAACGAQPRRCQHCVSLANCTGPFPFATGSLFSLSAPLAAHLAASPSVAADLQRTASLQPDHTIFEDIWLVRRSRCPAKPQAQRCRSPSKARTAPGPRLQERPTAVCTARTL